MGVNTTMTTTGRFTEQWTALDHELSPECLGRERYAGLFLGHKPESYDDQNKRVLLFGKSTAGGFAEEDAHERFFNGVSSFGNLRASRVASLEEIANRCPIWLGPTSVRSGSSK